MSWLIFLSLLARLFAGGLLLVAGIGKVRVGRADLLRSVLGYEVLPLPLARLWALLLPPLEIGLGILLILGIFGSLVAGAAAVLMVLVTVAVGQALVRGRSIPCGCFGKGTTLLTWRVVARNAVVIAVLAALATGGNL